MIVSGKTVEDAIRIGLSQLNTTQDRVKVTVHEEPSKGFLGLIGAKEAKVELEKLPDVIEHVQIFLDDIFRSMDLVVSFEVVSDREGTLIHLKGEDLGILIGRRGQTLDALQYLVNIVANRHSNTFIRVILDAENFRERRRKTLEDLALRLANRVTKTGKDVMLEPMSPQERKIIHSQLQDHPKVKTLSKGDEPNRRVVISLR